MIDKSKELHSSIELINDKVNFEGIVDQNDPISIDYTPPLGDNLGYTSLELFLLSISSCLGTSVLAFLRRMQKTINTFHIDSVGYRKQDHPTGFEKVVLNLKLTSRDVTSEDLMKVIKMSEETYCPVISMIKGNVEIIINFEINEENIIEIIDYSDDLKESIKILNYEWLEKYFHIEKGDIISLSNPKEEIIEKGGMIYYARLNNQIVGTVALLKKTDEIFEIAKMAVTADAQGYGIGTVLLEHCLNVAKQKSVQTLILYSNTKLESAIHLYRKYGFYEVELELGLYDRANIKMEKQIFS